MSLSEELLMRAHEHAVRNRQEIEQSSICGCFYCGTTFPPSAINGWLAIENTALCAECHIDSVLGDASGLPVSDPNFLHAMHERWFGDEDDAAKGAVSEPEVAFDHDGQDTISPHDPRAEVLARARGMPEDLIAMIKEGLKASREGRVSPSSEVFGRLAKRYGR